MVYLIILLVILVAGLTVYFKFQRNYFNKYQYMRVVRYNKDKTINVSYIKHTQFNKDNLILINPEHVYNFKGYTSIMLTSETQETINPLDFSSKYDAQKYKSAIKSKLISETFESLKQDKFDKIMALLFLNIIQLLAIGYLIYELVGGQVG